MKNIIIKYEDVYGYYGAVRLYRGYVGKKLTFIAIGAEYRTDMEVPRPSSFLDLLYYAKDDALFTKFLLVLANIEKDRYHGFQFSEDIFSYFADVFESMNRQHAGFDAYNYDCYWCITPPRTID